MNQLSVYIIVLLVVFTGHASVAGSKLHCADLFLSSSVKSKDIQFLTRDLLNTTNEIQHLDQDAMVDRSFNQLFSMANDLAKKLNAEGPYKSIPMARHYYYKHFSGSSSGKISLTAEELSEYKIEIRDGLLYRSDGKLLETRGHRWTYVVFNGELFAAPHKKTDDGNIKHATILMGLPAMGAGEIRVSSGQVTTIDNNSGRYRLPYLFSDFMMSFLENMNVDTSSIKVGYSLRKSEYLSDYDIARFTAAGIKITDSMRKAHDLGRKILSKRLKCLDGISKMTSEELWDLHYFLLDWGTPVESELKDLSKAISKMAIRATKLGEGERYFKKLRLLSPFYPPSRSYVKRYYDRGKFQAVDRYASRFLRRTQYMNLIYEN